MDTEKVLLECEAALEALAGPVADAVARLERATSVDAPERLRGLALQRAGVALLALAELSVALEAARGECEWTVSVVRAAARRESAEVSP